MKSTTLSLPVYIAASIKDLATSNGYTISEVINSLLKFPVSIDLKGCNSIEYTNLINDKGSKNRASMYVTMSDELYKNLTLEAQKCSLYLSTYIYLRIQAYLNLPVEKQYAFFHKKTPQQSILELKNASPKEKNLFYNIENVLANKLVSSKALEESKKIAETKNVETYVVSDLVYVNITEASRILDLDRTTIQKRCKSGRIAEAVFIDGQWKLPIKCLKNYWPNKFAA